MPTTEPTPGGPVAASMPTAETAAAEPPRVIENQDASTEEPPPAAEAGEAEASRDKAESGGQDRPAANPHPEERQNGDLPDAILSEADRMIDKVFGDHVHQNPGTHLDGGIADDADWQERFHLLFPFSQDNYDLPSGAIGRRLVNLEADVINGIIARKRKILRNTFA